MPQWAGRKRTAALGCAVAKYASCLSATCTACPAPMSPLAPRVRRPISRASFGRDGSAEDLAPALLAGLRRNNAHLTEDLLGRLLAEAGRWFGGEILRGAACHANQNTCWLGSNQPRTIDQPQMTSGGTV